MEPKVKVVIENLEEKPSKWLMLEYENSSEIVGRENIIFTNVRDEKLRNLLKGLGEVYEESVLELGLDGNLIILEPQAPKLLTPEDYRLKVVNYVVVGGILGDHPPRGRTWKLLTSKLKTGNPRSLGRGQFAINGAVYVALQVARGLTLNDIPVVEGLEIEVSRSKTYTHTIYLPYVYPIVDGKPLIPRGLIEYLKGRIMFDELEEL